MKFSKFQIAYTLTLWVLIVGGIVLLIGGDWVGWPVFAVGLLMGIARARYAHNLDKRVTEEKAGGEDDV